jgi:hypothetical protein
MGNVFEAGHTRGISRRTFAVKSATVATGTALGFSGLWSRAAEERALDRAGRKELKADVIVAGGGLGGCAAALAALRHGLRVVMTEQTDWIGGQLTQQAVPPDEHAWIESFGCTRSYRELRNGIREYYRRHYPLTEGARARWNLNPGDGTVSRLCHEPRVALAVLESMLAPFRSSGQLSVLLEHQAIGAEVSGDEVHAVQFRSVLNGNDIVLRAPWFVDATELGDLLPLTKTEFVTGAESRKDTGELHAPEMAQPENHQAFTMCFAMDHIAGEDHTIAKPRDYAFWRDYVPSLKPAWPGKLLDFTYTHPASLQPRLLGFNPEGEHKTGIINLWRYRRIVNQSNFQQGTYPGDMTIVNWPQNDYLPGNLIGVTAEEAARHVQGAKNLSLSLLYWLQTEAPRENGRQGWPGLRLRPDVVGTADGLAKYPYVRESRRIRPVFRVVEQHVGREARAIVTGQKQSEVKGERYFDSVGIGSYHIDLHPSTGGDNYIDFPSVPFEIPLGALLPQRVKNLIPACKNVGTTHVTNGCYRLHPVEWNIGEAAGALVAFAQRRKTSPHAVRESKTLLAEFQKLLIGEGVETQWPAV